MFTEAQEATYKAGLARFHQNNKVVGAGVYIQHGYILTCAHVVTQCLSLGKKAQEVDVKAVTNQPVKIDFPFVANSQFQQAVLVPSLWRLNNQDLAVLKIQDLAALPAGIVAPPIDQSTYYRDHRYHVFGFPEGHPDGLESRGEFLGDQVNGWIQMEDTKTQGVPIEPGFSGAPVWDVALEGIAGITVARDKDREDAKVGFMIPYQKLKPTLEAIALFELLLPEDANLTPHWQTAYQLLALESPWASGPETLQDAILQVQNMSAQGSEYRAIEQFIGYLALPELGLRIQPELIQWLQPRVTDMNRLLEVARQKLATHQAKQATAIAPHLLFWVQAELNSDRYYVQAYLVGDREQYNPLNAQQLKAPASFLEKTADGKVNQSEIEKILRACLNESGHELGDIRTLRLEVFLPLHHLHHLDWDVDQWAATDDPEPDLIGSRYQVVVRIVDRWEERYSQYLGDWTGKWMTLKNLSDRQAYRGLVCGDGQKFKQIRQRLRQAEVTGLILTQCPSQHTEDAPSPLMALIHAGSPVAIWPRQNIDDRKFKEFLVGCHKKFEQLMSLAANSSGTEDEEMNHQSQCDGLLGCCLSQIPENVRIWREQAELECDDGETHVGQQIGLIWEDPKLVPPGTIQPSRLRISA